MGTWGSGNFESDTAADHLSIVTARLVTEVAQAMAGDPVELEADEYWGVAVPCNLELLYLIAAQGHAGAELPQPQVVEAWKQAFMAVWERSVDGLDPAPGFKEERRARLLETFDRVAAAARSRAGRPGAAPAW
ncbi:DUF4259 domain-containing protein [Streptomyces yaizuensis]|uniref:DUF4259 domain-containing protein n=1 Tax=Streptomyces yaizuensis TaxID=2989713 RepID=A0ABQ5NXQ6_9ACTN|nr:DUF4259 domain-containing protein [Streptomyces sp. YSPA8]GLF94746.1 DUF4259 domain-containing protein [Streptomyces sp. YSPA8]